MTELQYDALNRLRLQIDAMNGHTQFIRDAADRLIQLVDARGNTTKLSSSARLDVDVRVLFAPNATADWDGWIALIALAPLPGCSVCVESCPVVSLVPRSTTGYRLASLRDEGIVLRDTVVVKVANW